MNSQMVKTTPTTIRQKHCDHSIVVSDILYMGHRDRLIFRKNSMLLRIILIYLLLVATPIYRCPFFFFFTIYIVVI